MTRSALFGRRIHIAGSVDVDPSVASEEAVGTARELVKGLVVELTKRGATFVVPVDAEKVRDADALPICFDWLVWETLSKSVHLRPSGAPNPLAIAVQHHKTENQIPDQFVGLWDTLRGTDLVQIENASRWNMASKRMEAQAQWGDILITLGGGEGVLYLANVYHDAGKPVVPLGDVLCGPDTGARHLFSLGLTSTNASRLFRATDRSAHAWINRLNALRSSVPQRVSTILDLLETLEPPTAFVVRLLNDTHPDYADVQAFFETIVRPIIEGELGYRMTVVDGRQGYEHARIDQEIFVKLHRSRIVLADLTGERPNCFLESGYALGRQLPTMVMCKDGTSHPFDLTTFAALHWKTTGTIDERRSAFRAHWTAIQQRPPLVESEPLIS